MFLLWLSLATIIFFINDYKKSHPVASIQVFGVNNALFKQNIENSHFYLEAIDSFKPDLILFPEELSETDLYAKMAEKAKIDSISFSSCNISLKKNDLYLHLEEKFSTLHDSVKIKLINVDENLHNMEIKNLMQYKNLLFYSESVDQLKLVYLQDYYEHYINRLSAFQFQCMSKTTLQQKKKKVLLFVDIELLNAMKSKIESNNLLHLAN